MNSIQIVNAKSQIPIEFDSKSGLGLTIGNFDGVHLGHQSLIQDLVQNCKNYNLKSLVLTFDPHPRQILSPYDPYAVRLFSIEDLSERLGHFLVDYLWVQNFNLDFAKLSPEEFIEVFLNHLPIKFLLVGHDFRFGHQREGKIEHLLKWCEKKKIPFKIFSPLEVSHQRVSSSLIKQCLLNADLAKAKIFLGRDFSVRGTVIAGHSRGQGIGFPTANLNKIIPLKNGVYGTELIFEGKKYKSITNVGLRPTVNANLDLWNKNVETHVLDQKLDLYSKDIQIVFLKFIREEKKFSSLDELKIQILDDLTKV